MATRIEKTDLARDALYDKVNVMIDEVNTKIDNKDSLPSQTGNTGKFLTTDGTNASWGEVKQIKIKQDLKNPTIDTVPSTKAVKDESSRIVSIMNNKISNCITYIPQNIKLELNNGTLTLKAGSKVYIPNGAGVFDVVTIASDIKYTYTYAPLSDSFVMLFINQSGTAFVYSRLENSCFSGETQPNRNYINWYKTNENRMYSIGNNATIAGYGFSFPIARVIQGSDGVTKSIDQVFNGFGYIGSTIFALPGVKGLIPNGRNADGSLKSIEFTVDEVKTFTNTFTNINDAHWLVDSYGVSINGAYSYNREQNFIYNLTTKTLTCEFAVSKTDSNSRITSFTPKTAFHAVDYNDAVKYSDRETVVGWGMPDYSTVISSLNATVPYDSFVYCRNNAVLGNPDAFFKVYDLSGTAIFQCRLVWSESVQFYIKKGNRYTVTGGTNPEAYYYKLGV